MRNIEFRQVINRKIYNTKRDKEVGFRSNFLCYSDMRWVEESLYKKRSGEFYILGQGGALSLYGRYIGWKCWRAGIEIIPLELEEAKLWVSKYLTAEEYEKIFKEKLEKNEVHKN